MTLNELRDLQELPMRELLRHALWATSFAQTSCSEEFDRVDKLQEAYKILYEVLTESSEYYKD